MMIKEFPTCCVPSAEIVIYGMSIKLMFEFTMLLLVMIHCCGELEFVENFAKSQKFQ